MTTPIPPAIKALRRSLRGATESGLRGRLSDCLRRVEALYGVPTDRDEDTGDMRRRMFVRENHRIWQKSL